MLLSMVMMNKYTYNNNQMTLLCMCQVELPEYFKPWNEIGKHVPELLTEHKLRDAVHKVLFL